MAESDSILQLGIEAARDGNREEARNLFRLLTRQEPSNAQAWLWLAGVAENRDERQAALERVVDLEPNNEMGIKGLQALGVRPAARPRDESPTVVPVPTSAPTMPVAGSDVTSVSSDAPTVAPVDNRARYDVDDDDPYAALDTLSDAMAESPTAVRRSEPLPGDDDPFNDLSNAINNDTGGRVGRDRARTAAASSRSTRQLYDDDDTVPARRGISPLLLGAVILVLLLVLGWVIWNLLFGNQTPSVVQTGPTTEQTAIAANGTAPATDGTNPATGATDIGAEATAAAGGLVITNTQELSPTTAVDQAATPATEPPAGETTEGAPTQPAVVSGDLANAQPALVNPGTPLSSEGWQYDFNQPSYAVQLNGGVGNLQPQGRFVNVLVFIANNTGAAQTIPADFFVLKDAQGRVYQPIPAASSAYIIRGVNADLSLEDQLPSDGLIRSVPIVFDVQPGATNLTLFTRSNTSQGWVVLSGVQ